jgi:hypothetical protein
VDPAHWLQRAPAADSLARTHQPPEQDVTLARDSGTTHGPESPPSPAPAKAPVPAVKPEPAPPSASEQRRAIAMAPRPQPRPKRIETRGRAPERALDATSPNRTSPDELDLFRAAQRLQAANAEPLEVLAAWDGYLTRFPDGVLALEARFNRARSLARLGQRTAAAQELGQFANGSFGGYRRSQAATLVRVLNSGE